MKLPRNSDSPVIVLRNRLKPRYVCGFNFNLTKNICSERKETKHMMITRNNLNEVLFENHDARLLIEYVVTHTQATLYYYHGIELTVENALKLYNRAIKAEELVCSMPLNPYNNQIKEVAYS